MYSRTTITVPKALKRRMRVLGTSVNWSAVACAAFEAKLSEVEKCEEAQSMDDVVARLRRTQGAESDATRQGRTQGQRWAMNQASAAELGRLEEFRREFSDPQWAGLFETERCWRAMARAIRAAEKPPRAAEEPSARPDRSLKAFWRGVLGETRPPDLSFFRGFAEGALDIWRQAKDRL